ncbi:hypothetical protein IWW37_000756 [Coemansia sp. RSA 2050]|nr:hypothetical protein IWW37_000756 [Coemansia sp. RSA 2050]KAJ2735880.1 hypothetical protein IW152_001178 [Coemansia sp. BCRC 34962]
MTSYIFRYFDTIGLGETIRLLLTAAKVDWTEENPEWPQEKANQPFGRLPVLIERSADGSPDFVLSESSTIERYLARTYGFLPIDPRGAALQEQLRDRQIDLIMSFRGHLTLSDSAKEEAYAKFEGLLDKMVNIHTAILRENGNTGYSFGSKLSYTDMAMYSFMKMFVIQFVQYSEKVPKLFKAKLTPELIKMASTLEADPLLEAYVSKRGRVADVVQV